MVREVIHCSVGQAGNQIGTKFWETVCQEHGLGQDGSYKGTDIAQLEKIDVYFTETSMGTFVPRAVLVDMDMGILNHITSRPYGKMYRPENFLSTPEGAANNFMNGFYGESAKELSVRTADVFRTEVERTGCCQGFTFSHSSAGGTGSGLTMNLEMKARQLLEKSSGGTYFFTVFPSTEISNTVIEPYNTVLVLNKLMDVNNVVCFDNEALYKICFDTLKLETPTFGDMNRLIAMVMAGNTASFRFPGQINSDMNKLSYSLRCKNFMHFYTPSFAPLTSLRDQNYRTVTVCELVKQMTEEKNMMVECQPERLDLEEKEEDEDVVLEGKCFSYAAMFRGNMTTSEVDEALSYLRGDQGVENRIRRTIGQSDRLDLILDRIRSCQKYVNNPRPTFSTITNFPNPGVPMSVTYLRNTSAIKYKFLKVFREATKMFQTKAYTQWYMPELYEDPMDEETCVSLEGCIVGNDERGETSMVNWLMTFGEMDSTEYPREGFQDKVAESMVLQ